MAKYIALHALQLRDDKGRRLAIEPKSDKASGLFEHTFDEKEEARLLERGAIRKPEGTETHEDATPAAELHDSRLEEAAPEKASKTAKTKSAKSDDVEDLTA